LCFVQTAAYVAANALPFVRSAARERPSGGAIRRAKLKCGAAAFSCDNGPARWEGPVTLWCWRGLVGAGVPTAGAGRRACPRLVGELRPGLKLAR
jgi:hypothetical protein